MSGLKTVWRILNLSCEEISRLASESLDRELDLPERIALWSHLWCCVACRRFRRQIELIRVALQRHASRDEAGAAVAGQGLPEDVRERIKRALKGT
jgi:hypothetical protein